MGSLIHEGHIVLSLNNDRTVIMCTCQDIYRNIKVNVVYLKWIIWNDLTYVIDPNV